MISLARQREHLGDVLEQRLFDRPFAQQRRRGEGKPLAVALDAQSHETGAALLHDLLAALASGLRRAPGVAAAERRMAGERQLEHGREDPQPVVGLGRAGRQHEGRLRQVGPGGVALHLLGREAAAVEHHANRVAQVGDLGEDIDDVVRAH